MEGHRRNSVVLSGFFGKTKRGCMLNRIRIDPRHLDETLCQFRGQGNTRFSGRSKILTEQKEVVPSLDNLKRWKLLTQRSEGDPTGLGERDQVAQIENASVPFFGFCEPSEKCV